MAATTTATRSGEGLMGSHTLGTRQLYSPAQTESLTARHGLEGRRWALGTGYWVLGIGHRDRVALDLGTRGDTLTDHFHSLGGRCVCSSFIAIAIITIIFSSSPSPSSTSTSSEDNSNNYKTIASHQ